MALAERVGARSPTVAVVWQRFLGWAFDSPVPAVASVVLGLTVWSIYLADRWWDARSGPVHQPRHTFAAAHPGLIVVSAAAALLVSAGFTFTLPIEYFTVGGIVAVLVAAYFGLVHLLKPNTVTARGGKEMLVGLLFAAGVAVPLVAAGHDIVRWLPATAGFGVICWLNCRVIDRWEGDVTGDDTREPSLGITAVVLASLVPRPLPSRSRLLRHSCSRCIWPTQDRPRVVRVLADVVLLTPLLVWVLP